MYDGDALFSLPAHDSSAGSRMDESLAPDWSAALQPVAGSISRMASFLDDEVRHGRPYLPAPRNVLRVFRQPLADVRVVIIGQDPYPTPGHAVGLSFSVHPRVRPLPRSLTNIYRELQSDLGIAVPAHGDLSAWGEQGVLLLNRVLTVQEGMAGSHRGRGWEAVTDAAVRALAARRRPLVAMLWGRHAQELKPLLDSTAVIESAHPSPLSAARGFFGSRPFSRANALLRAQGADEIDWRLPSG